MANTSVGPDTFEQKEEYERWGLKFPETFEEWEAENMAGLEFREFGLQKNSLESAFLMAQMLSIPFKLNQKMRIIIDYDPKDTAVIIRYIVDGKPRKFEK